MAQEKRIYRSGEPIASPLPLPVKKPRQKEDFPLAGSEKDEFDIDIPDDDIRDFDDL